VYSIFYPSLFRSTYAIAIFVSCTRINICIGEEIRKEAKKDPGKEKPKPKQKKKEKKKKIKKEPDFYNVLEEPYKQWM
jgi:hypothetical protein